MHFKATDIKLLYCVLL